MGHRVSQSELFKVDLPVPVQLAAEAFAQMLKSKNENVS
jgi:hypothetical protein